MADNTHFNRTWEIIFRDISFNIILQMSNESYTNLHWRLNSQAGTDLSLNIFATIEFTNLNNEQVNILANTNNYVLIQVIAGYANAGSKKVYEGTVMSINSRVAGELGSSFVTTMTCIDQQPSLSLASEDKKLSMLKINQATYESQFSSLMEHYKMKSGAHGTPFSYVLDQGSRDANAQILEKIQAPLIFTDTNSMANTLDIWGRHTKTLVRKDSTSGVTKLFFFPLNINRDQRASFLDNATDTGYFINQDTGMQEFPYFDAVSNVITVKSRVLGRVFIGGKCDVDVSNIAISNQESFFNKSSMTQRVDRITMYVISIYYILDSWGNDWVQVTKGFAQNGIRNV